MPTKKWAETRWGDPLAPDYEEKRRAAMSKAEREEARKIEKEEYEHAKVALAMGAATLNEKALLAHGAKAMFACAHRDPNKEEGDCITVGVAAILALTQSLPIHIEDYEVKLTKLWKESHETLSDRVRKKRFPLTTPMIERLQTKTRSLFHRDICRSLIRFNKRGDGSFLNLYADYRRTEPPTIDKGHPQKLCMGTDYFMLSLTRRCFRFGKKAMVLREDRQNPGHYWILRHRHGSGTMKEVVYVKDATINPDKPRYKLVKMEEK